MQNDLRSAQNEDRSAQDKLVPQKWTLIYILQSPFLGHKFCLYAEHIRSAQNEDRFTRNEDGSAQNNLRSAQNGPRSAQKHWNVTFCTLVLSAQNDLRSAQNGYVLHKDKT